MKYRTAVRIARRAASQAYLSPMIPQGQGDPCFPAALMCANIDEGHWAWVFCYTPCPQNNINLLATNLRKIT